MDRDPDSRAHDLLIDALIEIALEARPLEGATEQEHRDALSLRLLEALFGTRRDIEQDN